MSVSRFSVLFAVLLAMAFVGCSRKAKPCEKKACEEKTCAAKAAEDLARNPDPSAALAEAFPSVDVTVPIDLSKMPELPPVKPAEVKEQPADEMAGDIESCETLGAAYEAALEDTELTEEQRAALIVSAAQKVTDEEELGRILQEIDEVTMKKSTCVRALVTIMKTGNETSKKLLQEVINDLTGTDADEGLISTPEALLKWYNDPSGDNKDDPEE